MEPYLGVFGHTALDIIIRVSRLPDIDSSIGIDERVRRFGGTAANIARASAKLGVNVTLCSFVGEDFPEDYYQALKESGVKLSGLEKIEGYSTPRCWIVTDQEGKEFTLVDQGVMEHAHRFEPPVEAVKDCEVIHIGTGKPNYYEKLFDLLNTNDKLIAFDPAQELEYVYDAKTFKAILEKSDIFMCNEKEKDVALDHLKLNTVKDILREYSLNFVIVTKGSDGSTLFFPEEDIDITAYEPDRKVEATGAGDAFRAGFYAAMCRNFSIEDCCRFGSARASFALEHSGSQKKLVSWDEVTDRVESK